MTSNRRFSHSVHSGFNGLLNLVAATPSRFGDLIVGSRIFGTYQMQSVLPGFNREEDSGNEREAREFLEDSSGGYPARAPMASSAHAAHTDFVRSETHEDPISRGQSEKLKMRKVQKKMISAPRNFRWVMATNLELIAGQTHFSCFYV